MSHGCSALKDSNFKCGYFCETNNGQGSPLAMVNLVLRLSREASGPNKARGALTSCTASRFNYRPKFGSDYYPA